MATATMATAAGAAALLYYTLNRKLQSTPSQDDDEDTGSKEPKHALPTAKLVAHRHIQAPATWLDTISTLSETLRFTYSETLGKWPIGDLAFGISFLLKRQGNLHVASVFGGNDSLQLRGSQVTTELRYLLKLLTLCWHFSKKPFPLFLKETGYSQEDVLLQEPKAGILKPAFTILVDDDTKCFLLLIRGTHSIKDTLTAATGAVVPFHHTIVHEGGVSNLVLGYAHCGMVAAARWIAKLATPCLLKALEIHPDYKIKIVGHSLGGGTAAILTYTLREQREFSKTTCVTFAPAACMTWELAESGKEFITSVINGADLVPTFSPASVDDLRSEVTASAWLNDLRNQIEQTRILSTVYRSASALGSHLPSIASAKAKVAGAGAILRPVSNGTQVVMKRAQSMAQAAWSRPALHLSSWSCMGPRNQGTFMHSPPQENSRSMESSIGAETAEPLLSSCETVTTVETKEMPTSITEVKEWASELECSHKVEICEHTDLDDSEDPTGNGRHEDRMTEVELWEELEQELYRRTEGEEADITAEMREADITAEMREEEEAAISEVVDGSPKTSAPEMKETFRFFPPGKIMHIVTLHSEGPEFEGETIVNSEDTSNNQQAGPKVRIFLTSRSLYSKLRLSQTMVSDHFMPAYKKQIEQVINELEEEEASVDAYL
ncbi:hypothetical protein NE237_026852 [Protea cynaroides]|uniref:Sn1-specific diacylglycerol lipase alpha n=1 Tax=Protea cynaroides TaxID=273540 RepID=A0A9Q0GPD2_9MAGN|nr:hypothetical protein NE237_026852 [Protea cynaroides]